MISDVLESLKCKGRENGGRALAARSATLRAPSAPGAVLKPSCRTPPLSTPTPCLRARAHTHTRTDHAKHLFAADLRGLDASVRALERVFKEIREHAAREAAAVPKARALLQAARTQQQALAQIAANLPAHLPGAPGGIAAAAGGGSFSSKAAGAAADGGAAAPGLRRGEWSRRLCECKCCHQCRCWALAALVTCLDVCVALLSTAPLLPKLVHTHTHSRQRPQQQRPTTRQQRRGGGATRRRAAQQQEGEQRPRPPPRPPRPRPPSSRRAGT